MTSVAATARKIIDNVEQVVVGKRPQIVLSLVACFCEGHILFEDVPGVAKTVLARALARSISARFSRVQCTPDLLPSDVTGASIYNQKRSEFEFRPGPLFAQIVLVDEINRATPRTQSALLEAMAERRVSVDGQTYELEPPFLVVATQNPIDHEGTFPLPEAQLDRFLIRLSLGYPTLDEEERIVERVGHQHPLDSLEAVVDTAEVLACQRAVPGVHVDPKVRRYALELVHATREHPDVLLGGSPRASLALVRTSQALAAIRGRSFVIPDDVKRVAHAVLDHRMILRPESRIRSVTAAATVDEVLDAVPVPVLEGSSSKAAPP